eukprot:3168813-Heterocapsa_arctica.AAC.1
MPTSTTSQCGQLEQGTKCRTTSSRVAHFSIRWWWTTWCAKLPCTSQPWWARPNRCWSTSGAALGHWLVYL